MLLETGNLELFVFNRLTHGLVSSLPGLFLEDCRKFCLLRADYLELVYPVSPCIKILTKVRHSGTTWSLNTWEAEAGGLLKIPAQSRPDGGR